MATVTFTVPNDLATELNQIAVKAGYANAKLMVIAYLRATIRASRIGTACAGIPEAAEEQADVDTAAII